MYFTLRTS